MVWNALLSIAELGISRNYAKSVRAHTIDDHVYIQDFWNLSLKVQKWTGAMNMQMCFLLTLWLSNTKVAFLYWPAKKVFLRYQNEHLSFSNSMHRTARSSNYPFSLVIWFESLLIWTSKGSILEPCHVFVY